jgi:hypothetical protein
VWQVFYRIANSAVSSAFQIHKSADLGGAYSIDGREVRLFMLSAFVKAANVLNRSRVQFFLHEWETAALAS